MDAETKDLWKSLADEIRKNRKPPWVSVAQSVIIAAIVAIPTAITVINKVENRIISHETEFENVRAEIKTVRTEIETEDKFIRNEVSEIKKNTDFNFSLIESEHKHLKFIKLQ